MEKYIFASLKLLFWCFFFCFIPVSRSLSLSFFFMCYRLWFSHNRIGQQVVQTILTPNHRNNTNEKQKEHTCWAIKMKEESKWTHFKQFGNEAIDEIMFPVRLRVILGLQLFWPWASFIWHFTLFASHSSHFLDTQTAHICVCMELLKLCVVVIFFSFFFYFILYCSIFHYILCNHTDSKKNKTVHIWLSQGSGWPRSRLFTTISAICTHANRKYFIE